jgi:hypothetical protein
LLFEGAPVRGSSNSDGNGNGNGNGNNSKKLRVYQQRLGKRANVIL